MLLSQIPGSRRALVIIGTTLAVLVKARQSGYLTVAAWRFYDS